MPVYEYECAQCGARSEFLETLGGGRVLPRKCRACGSPGLKRIVSGFVYNRPVTLEDLGVKVDYRQQSPMPAPQGPPPGGCPYAQAGQNQTDTPPPGAPPKK